MAARMQAIKSVTRNMVPAVKPSLEMGLNTTKKTPVAVMGTALPAITEKAVAHADPHPWGVTWPGHADKWGKEEPPMIDWDEIATSFKTWKDFDVNISETCMGVFGMVLQAAGRFQK